MSQKTLDPSLTLLNQLFSAATGHASSAMSQWTSGQITLSLDEVRKIPLEEISAELDIDQDLLTMVVLSLEGSLGGQLILTFDESNGRRLAASLLGREVRDEPEWSELEKSALNETGNILVCAYLKVLTDVTKTELVPSPPYFIQDYGASVLEQAVMAQAMVGDSALVCRTTFRREDEEMNWNLFFVPTQELLATLETALESNP